MRELRRALVAAVVLLAGVAQAFAQFPVLGPNEQPASLVREALASPYGRAFLGELGKGLRAAADPACLQSKSLTADQLAGRGAELITAGAIRGMEKTMSFFDPKAYEEKFAASAGPKAKAEMAKLRETPDVKRYLALERPLRLTKILDTTFEQFDRSVLLSRLKLGPISPLPSGNAQLLDMDPSEAAEAALKKFEKANKSASLRRYLVLAEKSSEAWKPSLTPELAAGIVLSKVFFGSIEDDLAALCIGKR